MLVSHNPFLQHCRSTGGFSSAEPNSCRLNSNSSNYYSSLDNYNSYDYMNSTTLTTNKRYNSSPKRPCLIVTSNNMTNTKLNSNLKKKKVVFADDKGMSLTHIRTINELPHIPPLWSLQFLAEITNMEYTDLLLQTNQKESWEILFPQPASDYIDFRKKLTIDKVSLENVIVKEAENILMGTIKVSNIDFQKSVIVRSSSDDWKTFEDTECSYVPNTISNNTSAKIIYDTFSFNINLPEKSNKLEFCVRFTSGGYEFWDSNFNHNYLIIKQTYNLDEKKVNNVDRQSKIKSAVADVVHAKLDSWSEFASWTHLDNTNPYW